jgi:hypothetical protein
MKAKVSLLGVAFIAILLVALILVPAVASAAPGGSDGGKPVNWVTWAGISDVTGFWTMNVVHVQKLQNGTVKGTFLDQSIGKVGENEYRFCSRSFESKYWDDLLAKQGQPSLSRAYFCHGAAYPTTLWPTPEWIGAPSTFDTFADVDIADFVVYVPADQLDPAWLPLYPDSMPLRYVLLDFGKPRKGIDRFMAWAFVPSGDPADPDTFWFWYPMSDAKDLPILDPVPVLYGSIQVHVGAPDSF